MKPAAASPRVSDLTVDELLELVQVEKPLLLNQTQAAALLGGIDRHHVGWLVREGHLKTVPLGPAGGYARIPREEVERLAREGVPQRPERRRRARKEAPAVADLTALDDWSP